MRGLDNNEAVREVVTGMCAVFVHRETGYTYQTSNSIWPTDAHKVDMEVT